MIIFDPRMEQSHGNKTVKREETLWIMRILWPNGWDKGNIHYARFMSYSNIHYMLYLLSMVHWSKVKEMTRQNKKQNKTAWSAQCQWHQGAEPSIRCLSHPERDFHPAKDFSGVKQNCKPPKALEMKKEKKNPPKRPRKQWSMILRRFPG